MRSCACMCAARALAVVRDSVEHLQGHPRACMGRAWGLHGACTGPAWGLHGACMGPAWGLHGACMGPAWGLHGACTGPAWGLHGACMGPARAVHTHVHGAEDTYLRVHLHDSQNGDGAGYTQTHTHTNLHSINACKQHSYQHANTGVLAQRRCHHKASIHRHQRLHRTGKHTQGST